MQRKEGKNLGTSQEIRKACGRQREENLVQSGVNGGQQGRGQVTWYLWGPPNREGGAF